VKLEASIMGPKASLRSVPLPPDVEFTSYASKPMLPSDDTKPAWQSYSDPRRLTGYGEPALSDASPRLLKIDVRFQQTNVISPMFMIPMPCGSLVELAQYYEPTL